MVCYAVSRYIERNVVEAYSSCSDVVDTLSGYDVCDEDVVQRYNRVIVHVDQVNAIATFIRSLYTTVANGVSTGSSSFRTIKLEAVTDSTDNNEVAE